jgi:glycosyltransferase involved in cell wall biosynthesis
MFKIAVTAPRPPWADQPEFRNFVWIGRAKSAEHMSAIYNSVDAVVIPSRVESNSLVSMEAQACGKPVIGFRSSGFAETVIDGVTGFLADPYEITSLARAIRSALSLDRVDTQLSCRARAEEVWSASVIAQRHIQVYEQTLMA